MIAISADTRTRNLRMSARRRLGIWCMDFRDANDALAWKLALPCAIDYAHIEIKRGGGALLLYVEE